MSALFLRGLLVLFFSITHFYSLFANTQVVVLLGKPGAGKGTVGARLSQEFGLKRISSGEFLLSHIERDTELGWQVKPYVIRGDMPPDELVVEAFFEYFRSLDFSNGCILDGFPRTVNQAKLLSDRLPQNIRLTVIHLDVPDQIVLDRIEQRLVCQECMYPYHLSFAPPRKEGICDFCGGRLYRRSDDVRESIMRRLVVYQERTQPVVEYYREVGKLIPIRADSSIEDVYTNATQENDLRNF